MDVKTELKLDNKALVDNEIQLTIESCLRTDAKINWKSEFKYRHISTKLSKEFLLDIQNKLVYSDDLIKEKKYLETSYILRNCIKHLNQLKLKKPKDLRLEFE
jgi:hypothetical protein